MTPRQIDDGAVIGLDVASDEAHVLVLRSSAAASGGAYHELGALAVVTVDASGGGSTRELTTAVYVDTAGPWAGFTAGADALYYVDFAHSPPALRAAAADGSNPLTLATGTIQSAAVAGSTLVYVVDPTMNGNAFETWAVTLPGGAPVQLVPAVPNPPGIDVDVTGSAMVWTPPGSTSSSLLLPTSGKGSVTVLQATSWSWSPDGAHLAYWHSATGALHVVNADAGGDTTLLVSGLGTSPAWSPDGQAIVFGVTDPAASTVSTAIVHPLSGGADVALGAGADLSPALLSWSAHGGLVLAAGAGGRALMAADARQAGSFVTVVDDLQAVDPAELLAPPFDVAPTEDEVAATLLATSTVVVAPVSGGAEVSLPVQSSQFPLYEPVGSDARLLVFADGPQGAAGYAGTLALYDKDGSGLAVSLPGAVMPSIAVPGIRSRPVGWEINAINHAPFAWGWLGRSAIWNVVGSPPLTAFDVAAASDDGAKVGLIAPGAVVWNVHRIATSTRLFFGRTGATRGLWWSPVP